MAELLIELFCEEIPAGLQARAANDLSSLVTRALDSLNPRDATPVWGPRRIALILTVDDVVPASTQSERGPRESAPEQALAGFLRKHGATREMLTQENGFWVLNREIPSVSARDRIAAALPDLLWRFPWPKSMRWGDEGSTQSSLFTWVRPLRRILCLLDGAMVPFSLAREGDDAHGLASSDLSEGHRFLAPEPFHVTSAAQWRTELAARHVVVEATERESRISAGIAALADGAGLRVVDDPGLVEEVAGLTEYPSPLLGSIDAAFMDLPPEVMQVSMRVNQRYFALRTAEGAAAPHFAFVANMTFADDGELTIAGNERVLRARFADARHFWDLDRARTLESRVAALDAVTFHAKLGSQGARVARIERLAAEIAPLVGADPSHAARAARLAKADLTTGMVGEFPELQGVMGRYYALHDGEDAAVAEAVSAHYQPKGAADDTPRAPVSIAVALADRLDLLAGFFAIGETPTGSGDPYALRRAALGVIRIVRDNALRLDLRAVITAAEGGFPDAIRPAADTGLIAFLADRLRVQLRSEGARHDVLSAVLAGGLDGDLTRLLARTEALAAMLETEDGRNLLAASKRAANILRIEEKKDGPHDGRPDPSLYREPAERGLAEALTEAVPTIHAALMHERFDEAMRAAAGLRPSLDRFFQHVTVNDADPALRANRLALLAALRHTLTPIADFGQIEG